MGVLTFEQFLRAAVEKGEGIQEADPELTMLTRMWI
jgi:hypothetical protein